MNWFWESNDSGRCDGWRAVGPPAIAAFGGLMWWHLQSGGWMTPLQRERVFNIYHRFASYHYRRAIDGCLLVASAVGMCLVLGPDMPLLRARMGDRLALCTLLAATLAPSLFALGNSMNIGSGRADPGILCYVASMVCSTGALIGLGLAGAWASFGCFLPLFLWAGPVAYEATGLLRPPLDAWPRD